jgi:alkanesulfonate monooxygenase SsuD/methylene tetrahydromethanopterin reductase-like flavin-dependent oxidoreductase (luciferase family)
VPRDPRRRALIGQAGASGPGLDFAATYGEIIYCSLLSLPAARHFRDEVHARAKTRGRAAASLRIVPGLVPIIGRTREEALERHDAVSGTGSAGAKPREAPGSPLDRLHLAHIAQPALYLMDPGLVFRRASHGL